MYSVQFEGDGKKSAAGLQVALNPREDRGHLLPSYWQHQLQTWCLFQVQVSDVRFVISITERYSRHSVGKEFSLGLLEYENTRPMYDINEVKSCYLLSEV